MNKLKYNGQAQQDKFVCNVLKNKTQGFFLEIGSFHPIEINNTYLLESEFQWTGLMFEYMKENFEKLYKIHRPNSNYIFGDATKHNYSNIFSDYNVRKNIDYLQLDIHPPQKTLEVLKRLNTQVMDSHKFAVITFEHDYKGDDEVFYVREESREIFKNRGYHLVLGDITTKHPKYVYEDWYVHPELVDMNYIKKLQSINKSMYGNGFGKVDKTLKWEDIKYIDR